MCIVMLREALTGFRFILKLVSKCGCPSLSWLGVRDCCGLGCRTGFYNSSGKTGYQHNLPSSFWNGIRTSIASNYIIFHVFRNKLLFVFAQGSDIRIGADSSSAPAGKVCNRDYIAYRIKHS